MLKKKLSKILATVAMPFLLTPTIKAENPSIYIYFNEGQSVYHQNARSRGEWNESNKIRGIGMEINENLDFLVQKNINSYNVPSTMIGYNYKTCFEPENVRYCFGITFGLRDGSPLFDYKPFPDISAYAGIEYKHIGIDINLLAEGMAWNYKFKF